MNKFLPYLSALGIILFIYFLLPPGQHFLSNIGNNLDNKKDSVVAGYNEVKDNVEGFTETVTDTQEKLEDTVQKVNETKTSIDELDQKMKQFVKATEDLKNAQQPWQTSDPKLDPSIDAGRVNYNYADPGEDGLSKAHLELDIKPWLEWGNSEEDSSTKEERIEALSKTELGKKMLEKLRYDY